MFPTLTEVVIAGVWAASAVEVFVLAWEAYSGEWKAFPGIQAGGTQTFDPAHPPSGIPTPGLNQTNKTIAENLRPPADIISQISTLYNNKKNLDPGVNRLVRYALQQYPHAKRIDVLVGVIIYVEGHWPGGQFTHTVGPDPKNPVKIPNLILQILKSGKLTSK